LLFRADDDEELTNPPEVLLVFVLDALAAILRIAMIKSSREIKLKENGKYPDRKNRIYILWPESLWKLRRKERKEELKAEG
jgi:transcription initiation factor IIE alpha subunit